MNVVSRAVEFIQSCGTGLPGEYKFYPGGQVCLYASCYAAMALYYAGQLQVLSQAERTAWCEYINSWQDPETGYFLGPELSTKEFAFPGHDYAYVRLHLLIHVLPAIEILGGRPLSPMKFARQFIDLDFLKIWLTGRDWRQAWLEGNKLLCLGQLLVYLRDKEHLVDAQRALDYYFDWLDARVDSATGLWGTNGYCDTYTALYGAAHQLIVYYACGRPVKFPNKIVDTVLSLQQNDGSFSPTPGGGACEDVDAILTLVELVKQTGYRVGDVRLALRRALPHILRQQGTDGGFVYRWGRSYMQGGVLRAFVPSNTTDIFSTWYRLHTLALLNQVIDTPTPEKGLWQFNKSCSMGWHDLAKQLPRESALLAVRLDRGAEDIRKSIRSLGGNVFRGVLRQIPSRLVGQSLEWFLPRYVRTLPPVKGVELLLNVDQVVDKMGRERAYETGGGLDFPFWWINRYRFFVEMLQTNFSARSTIIHLGIEDGSLSYSLATLTSMNVTAVSWSGAEVDQAKQHYHHPSLSYLAAQAFLLGKSVSDVVVFTDLQEGNPAWDRWRPIFPLLAGKMVLAQLSPVLDEWSELQKVGYGLPDQLTLVTNYAESHVPAGWTLEKVVCDYGVIMAQLRIPSGHPVC